MDAEFLTGRGQGFGVGGVQAQVEVGEEGAFGELAVARERLGGLDCTEG